MKKKTCFLISIIISLLIVCFLLFYFVYPAGEAKEESLSVKTADQFLYSLTEYDIETAKELAAGTILANLSNTNRVNGDLSEHMVISSKISVINENEDWAKLYAELETKDRKTGLIDVHWYEIYLLGDDESNWRVYRIEETEVLPGKEQKVLPQNIEEATKVFGQYITFLSENKYEQAGELLVGQARTAHEQTKSILSKSPVLKYFKNIIIDQLYYDGKVLISKIQYRVDGRDAVLTVSFFQTSEGWRIYNVSQI